MEVYIGLDVSLASTAICVLDETFDTCAVLKDIHVLRDMDVRHAEEAEKRDKAEKRRHKADIRGDIRRHTEAMQAGERRHAEAMAALHELIRRTAAPQGA